MLLTGGLAVGGTSAGLTPGLAEVSAVFVAVRGRSGGDAGFLVCAGTAGLAAGEAAGGFVAFGTGGGVFDCFFTARFSVRG